MRALSKPGEKNARKSAANIEQLADFVSEDIIPKYPAGFTINPHTMSFPFFRPDEYLVSLRGHEGRIKTPVEYNDVKNWLNRNHSNLHGKYMGGWMDKISKEFVLDISIAVVGLENAISAAMHNQQEAIYWFYKQEAIYIKKHKVA